MTEINNPPLKQRRWWRKLAWFSGALIILLVAAYLVATSSAFLKGVILPRVSQSLGANVTIADAQISPFSHVELRELKVQAAGGEPLLTVQDIHANYSLWSILGGNLAVADVAVDSPVVTIVQNPDGSSNLDALTKTKTPSKASQPAAKPAPAAPGKPLQIDIKQVALNNATIRLVKKYANGSQDVTEVSGLNFTVNGLKNGQTGKIEIAAAIAVQKAAQTNAAAADLQAKLNGSFDLALTPDLKPGSVEGQTTFAVAQATGPLADLKDFTATLNCDLTPTDLKELALRLAKSGTPLGQIRVSGPFDPAKMEGQLSLVVSGIDQQALNLAAAAAGLEFGTTTFNCTNAIALTNGGKTISLAGNFDLAHLQVKQRTQTSPTLDLHSDYAITVDQTAQSAVLQKLNLTGTQDARDLLQARLSSPMTIPLGGSSSAVGDATLDFKIINLNLADWKAFTGEAGPGGVLNLAVKLISQKGGQQLGFQLDTHLDNLTTGSGHSAVNQGDLSLQASGNVTDLKLVKLDNYQLAVVRQGKPLANMTGSATFDTATQDADLQVAAQTALAELMAIPGASANDGAVGVKAQITSRQKKISLAGEVDLTPTERAKNVLQLNGNMDLAQADAITGSFKLSAEALDATRYYDLLSSMKSAGTNTPASATGETPPAKPPTEPAAITLPLKNFTLAVNIGHLFLREVDIANWQTTVLLDGDHVVLNPCQLTLNGAPIKATSDLNLGVPGYVYNVAFDANAIPLAPLVNSFAPDRKGQIAGTTSIGLQVKGAGVTGTSLQKNLGAEFHFTSTNLDLSIANVRSPLMNTLINAIVGLPNLIKNPAATLENLLGGTQHSGWADALTASPIEAITMQAKAGDGVVQLQSAEVRSDAFQARASGQIGLAADLNNSALAIPVQVALSRSMAEQIGLANAGTPTNMTYVALPDFLTMQGTIGKPQAKTDKLALVALAAKTTGGIAGKIGGAAGEKVGSALNAVEGLFGGGKSTPTNSTPAPTNSTPMGGLLKLFGK